MITYIKNGNLFESEADALVNATNIVGVMGGGIARAFSDRYPDYFNWYYKRCHQGLEKMGRVEPYYDKPTDTFLFSLHTKVAPPNASRYEHVTSGLADLRLYLGTEHIESVAIPALGCGLGGLRWDIVQVLIEDALDGEEEIDCDIKVYEPLPML